MNYVDGFVAAVENGRREAFAAYARQAAEFFRQHGALDVVDCWGDDVPDGKLTSFPMAVKLAPGETVVFSWVTWPSKAQRDAAFASMMTDPRFDAAANPMPFDGKRMIFGGFIPMR